MLVLLPQPTAVSVIPQDLGFRISKAPTLALSIVVMDSSLTPTTILDPIYVYLAITNVSLVPSTRHTVSPATQLTTCLTINVAQHVLSLSTFLTMRHGNVFHVQHIVWTWRWMCTGKTRWEKNWCVTWLSLRTWVGDLLRSKDSCKSLSMTLWSVLTVSTLFTKLLHPMSWDWLCHPKDTPSFTMQLSISKRFLCKMVIMITLPICTGLVTWITM